MKKIIKSFKKDLILLLIIKIYIPTLKVLFNTITKYLSFQRYSYIILMLFVMIKKKNLYLIDSNHYNK